MEEILKSYLEETIEEETIDEVKEEVVTVKEPKVKPEKEKEKEREREKEKEKEKVVPKEEVNLKFNPIDSVRDVNNIDNQISAPKTIDRLEKISEERYEQRKRESLEDDDDSDNEKISLSNENVHLDSLEIESLDTEPMNLFENQLDVEVLA